MTRVLARLERMELVFNVLALLGGAGALAVAFEAPTMFLVGAVASAVYPLARKLNLTAGTLLEGALTCVGILLALPLGLATREPAAGLAMFLLVAQATKLVAPRTHRDTGLARVVGIVLAGVAAAEGVELHFGAALFGCVLLNLLAGVLSTVNGQVRGVQPETPEPLAVAHPPVGGEPGVGRVLLAHGVVLALVGVLGGATFLIIPRMGAKLLPQRSASTERLSGFSDVVGLEDIGQIKLNTSVALRVELADPAARPADPYWRGAALDTYDGSVWKTSQLFSWGLRLQALDVLSVRDPLLAPQAGEARQATFYLQPIGTNYLFTVGTTKEIHFKNTRPRALRRNSHGGYTVRRPFGVGIAYRLDFYPDDAPQLALNPTLRRNVEVTCVSLPSRVNRSRMREYTRSVLLGRGLDPVTLSPSRLAAVLEAHLRSEFKYTTRSTRDPEIEPVEEFLWVKKAGHCEFFASALTVLLRCEQIPARVVTGFRGGEFNEWTGTYTIRQREAHAWVEAQVDGRWQRFDPTPADPQGGGGGGLFGAAGVIGDWIELKWFQYVIAFDAYDQQNALFLLREDLAPVVERIREVAARRGARWGLTLGALLLAVLLFFLARRGLRAWSWRGGLVLERGAAAGPPSAVALGRLLAALARHDLVRRPDETPWELARRAQLQLGLGEASLSGWVPVYYAVRFGGRSLEPAELDRVGQLVSLLDGLELSGDGS